MDNIVPILENRKLRHKKYINLPEPLPQEGERTGQTW
jgi:hypothetical protein